MEREERRAYLSGNKPIKTSILVKDVILEAAAHGSGYRAEGIDHEGVGRDQATGSDATLSREASVRK